MKSKSYVFVFNLIFGNLFLPTGAWLGLDGNKIALIHLSGQVGVDQLYQSGDKVRISSGVALAQFFFPGEN